jgi:hypothetical protein
MFKHILPTSEDTSMSLPGDDMIKNPSMSIDSAFELSASPAEVYPWFVQLGKQRAGWYFTRFTEKFFLPSARGIHYIEQKWQNLKVGDRIPDYGKDGYFDCFYLEENRAIGYTSTRGKVTMTWVLTFWKSETGTRVIIRLRATGFKSHNSFFMTIGKFIDRLTISWLAAGLRERVNSKRVE